MKKSQKVLVNQELWESLKYLGMLNKILISNFNAVEDNDTLIYDAC